MTADALVDRVRARLALQPGAPSSAGVAALVREEAGGLLGDDDVLRAVRIAVDELAGAGPLEPLLRLPGVTDVLVNGPDQVWVDSGDGLRRADVRFPDDDAVRRLAVRLAAASGRRLDDAAPWVNVALPDGTRLHAVLPPVSGRATSTQGAASSSRRPDAAANRTANRRTASSSGKRTSAPRSPSPLSTHT